MACWDGFGNLADGRPFWIADFNGDGRDEILFYSPGDDNWWLATRAGTQLGWSLVGNTAGFGHAINDGRPFWAGRFVRGDRDSVLFYYPGDDNWWVGTVDNGQLQWSLAGNTRGFGHAINDGRPFWTGDFDGDGRTDMLFYYPGDDNWWHGRFVGTTLVWSLAGNTAGFGHAINDGRPFWRGRFAMVGRDSMLFYYPGDDNWWLGTLINGRFQWALAGNTRGFGHAINDGRPFWTADFNGDGLDEVLFYYPGDDNWWLGSFGSNQLSWRFAGNTAGFGHAINDGRPFWVGNFVWAGQASMLFYYPGDDNWWVGTLGSGQLQWSWAGNTAGFGHAINDGRPFWTGRFDADARADMLFYYPGDGNWWLGSHSGPGGQLGWSLVGNTGRRFDRCVRLNLILVGIESFTAADIQKVADMLAITRSIYGQVSLGIPAVEWFQITNTQAGALAVIDSEAECVDLTEDWTVNNGNVDVFIVRSMNGGADGRSPVNGPCDKNAKGMSGPVVSLNGSTANAGNSLAHELGHYLGLDHIPDIGNFIGGDGGSNSWTGIHAWQGDVMKRHCATF